MLRFLCELPFTLFVANPAPDPDLSVALCVSILGLVCTALLWHVGLSLHALHILATIAQ